MNVTAMIKFIKDPRVAELIEDEKRLASSRLNDVKTTWVNVSDKERTTAEDRHAHACTLAEEFAKLKTMLSTLDDAGREVVAQSNIRGTVVDYAIRPTIHWSVTCWWPTSDNSPGGVRTLMTLSSQGPARLIAMMAAKASTVLQIDLDMNNPVHCDAFLKSPQVIKHFDELDNP